MALLLDELKLTGAGTTAPVAQLVAPPAGDDQRGGDTLVFLVTLPTGTLLIKGLRQLRESFGRIRMGAPLPA